MSTTKGSEKNLKALKILSPSVFINKTGKKPAKPTIIPRDFIRVIFSLRKKEGKIGVKKNCRLRIRDPLAAGMYLVAQKSTVCVT